jgi:uncharacterized protein
MNNRQKLEAFNVACMKDDRAAAEALMHPDFTVNEPAGLPYGGTHKGKAAWWALFTTICRTWADVKFELETIIGAVDGEEFALALKISGRSALTGKPFATSIFEHWRLKDGLLWDVRPHYFDTKLLADCNTPNALETARKLLDAFVARDVEAALAVMDDRITIHAPYTPPDIPLDKRVVGKAAVKQMLTVMMGAMAQFRLLDVDLHTTDDPELVVGTGRSEATMRNGQAYGNFYVYQFHIRNGLIFDYYEFFDSHLASKGFSFAK